MASLAEIRAKLAQQENKAAGSVDNAIYAHWTIPENSTTTIRFLEDGDSSNTFFWAEKAMIRLPFSGIKDQPGSKPQIVQVPCMEMWGETCSVLTEVRTWFKDKSLEEQGRKYWKKRSYIMQGFVVDSGQYKEDSVPENPIRRFIVSPQLFNIVKAALMDPEIEHLVTDHVHGLDFKVVKTTKGQYADYSTSNYARRERSLNENELAAIQKHELAKLSDFLPKKPNELERKIIGEMFEASVNGEAYDNARWGQFFRPSGFGYSGGDAVDSVGSATAPAMSRVAPVRSSKVDVVEEEEAVIKPVASGTANTSKRAEDILAQIKARQSKTA